RYGKFYKSGEKGIPRGMPFSPVALLRESVLV
ncbi:MAG: hypothetical protein QOD32_1187, partial [Pyrinomonadaceae bacterium]|nr:hypothetical protein [Pyrinomonadaceae bacterium]